MRGVSHLRPLHCSNPGGSVDSDEYFTHLVNRYQLSIENRITTCKTTVTCDVVKIFVVRPSVYRSKCLWENMTERHRLNRLEVPRAAQNR